MTYCSRPLSLLAAAFAFGALTLSSATRADVYTQPSDFPGGNLYASQTDNGSLNLGAFAVAYDNFTLSSPASISSLTWEGGYYNPPAQGPISDFTITLYADSGNAPGTPLYTQVVPGTANETFVGDTQGLFPTYDYSATLTTPFSASAGTQYWLSVVPTLDRNFSQWGWHTGTGGDSLSYQNFFGSIIVNDVDFAFSLNGGGTPPVPEPGAVSLLLGISLSGATLLRRRRA